MPAEKIVTLLQRMPKYAAVEGGYDYVKWVESEGFK